MTDKQNTNLIITIDGPSGAGKSTVAKMIAGALGYKYIDTGAMYRGVAYAYRNRIADLSRNKSDCGPVLKQTGLLFDQPSDLGKFLNDLDLRFEFGKTAKVFFNGDDISEKIRDPEISLLASKLSQDRGVRTYCTAKQREIGKDGGVVLEGRDTGSVVFPDARMKFYLDADHNERARRRHLELSAKGAAPEISVVKEEMAKRDRDDSERDIAPLTIPENAKCIDTTGLNIEGVVQVILKHIKESGAQWKF